MKIGLISINMHTKSLNPACPIHTWAFQQFLLQNGLDSTVIDYIPNYCGTFPSRNPVPYYREKLAALEKKGVKNLSADGVAKYERYKSKLEGYQALEKEREEKFDKFQEFIDTNYKKTEEIWTEARLEIDDPGFDCYICVSDVIWSYDEYWGFEHGFLLDCAAMERKAKIAYAASRGVPKAHTPEQKGEFFGAVSRLDAIGVREQSLTDYINEALEPKRAVTVLDPVLLLKAKDYEPVLVKPEEENFVVLYYAMEKPKDLLEVVVDYAKKHHCTVIELSHIPIEGGLLKDAPVKSRYCFEAGPREWLGYLKYAKCVFTNSFHATCFSILFHTNFFNGKRNGDKLTFLRERFGLGNRLCSTLLDLEKEIDFEKVDAVLKKEREASAAFILGAISRVSEEQKAGWRRADTFHVAYNSRRKGCTYIGAEPADEKELRLLKSENLEYRPQVPVLNDGKSRLLPIMYQKPGMKFLGWHIRASVRGQWFYIRRDGSFLPDEAVREMKNSREILFEDQDRIPRLATSAVRMLVAEAKWNTTEEVPVKFWTPSKS